MTKKYKVFTVHAPAIDTVGSLQRALDEIPMDMQLKEVVPYHDDDGTAMYFLILEPLKFD